MFPSNKRTSTNFGDAVLLHKFQSLCQFKKGNFILQLDHDDVFATDEAFCSLARLMPQKTVDDVVCAPYVVEIFFLVGRLWALQCVDLHFKSNENFGFENNPMKRSAKVKFAFSKIKFLFFCEVSFFVMENLESEPLALRVQWIKELVSEGLPMVQARQLEDAIHFQRARYEDKP